LAGDSETLAMLGVQFAEKTVHKRYLALVHGRLEGSTDGQDWIAWNWPLTEAAAGRNDPIGKGHRMPCTTRCRIVGYSPHYSSIECEPLTGRKHQIRRHAKLAGHPVVGDRRYGSARSLAYLLRQHDFNRLALHAHSLTIRLPGENKNTTFKTDGLPEELRRLLENDRQ
jgi:23S rRNA-/tRNA-specific pseudouridylate synthase